MVKGSINAIHMYYMYMYYMYQYVLHVHACRVCADITTGVVTHCTCEIHNVMIKNSNHFHNCVISYLDY